MFIDLTVFKDNEEGGFSTRIREIVNADCIQKIYALQGDECKYGFVIEAVFNKGLENEYSRNYIIRNSRDFEYLSKKLKAFKISDSTEYQIMRF